MVPLPIIKHARGSSYLRESSQMWFEAVFLSFCVRGDGGDVIGDPFWRSGADPSDHSK